MKAALALLSLLALEVVAFVLWAFSGAIDCDPHCSTYQDATGWFAWFLIPLSILIVLAAVLIARLRQPRRKPGGSGDN